MNEFYVEQVKLQIMMREIVVGCKLWSSDRERVPLTSLVLRPFYSVVLDVLHQQHAEALRVWGRDYPTDDHETEIDGALTGSGQRTHFPRR